jgi:hypothetical protein
METVMLPDWFLYQSEDQALDLHVVREAQRKEPKKTALATIERGMAQLLATPVVDSRARQVHINAGLKYLAVRKAILFGATSIS